MDTWHRPPIYTWSRDGRLLYLRDLQFEGHDRPQREYIYVGTLTRACVVFTKVKAMDRRRRT